MFQDVSLCDVDTGDRPRVNKSPQPARLSRGLDLETHQAHSRADHPQAQNRRAADRPEQDRRRRLLGHRSDAADLPPLETEVRRYAGRGGLAADPAGEGKRPAQKAFRRSGAGESHAQRPCCAVRRTLRCDGKLLSPERRRRAFVVLQEHYRASERLVCRVVGQHRSTQHHPGKVVSIEEEKLRHRLRRSLLSSSVGAGGLPTACSGSRKACSALLPGSASGHAPLTDR